MLRGKSGHRYWIKKKTTCFYVQVIWNKIHAKGVSVSERTRGFDADATLTELG